MSVQHGYTHRRQAPAGNDQRQGAGAGLFSTKLLQDCRVLIVEDNYILADELAAEFSRAGAVIIGPVGAIADALAVVETHDGIDAVVLDTNLHGQMSYPVADRLIRGGVPVVFTTGYDASSLPEAYTAVARCQKPLDLAQVLTAVASAVHAAPPA